MTTKTAPTAEATDDRRFSVSLDLEEGYRFRGDFGLPGVAPMTLDEPSPLGGGDGPNPARLLTLAVGNCLASSLLFCLRKARIEPQGMTATADAEMARNERGRLRVSRIDVTLSPRIAAEDKPRMRRCLEIFEDFCPVTSVVREGVDVEVTVTPVVTG